MCHIQRRFFNRLHIWRTFYDGGNDGGGRTAFVGPPEPLLKDHFPLVFDVKNTRNMEKELGMVLPFKYLGMVLGGNPRRLSFWSPI